MSTITLSSPGLTLDFDIDHRLSLRQVRRECDRPLLYGDRRCKRNGSGPVGNPLAVVIQDGVHAGIYGIETFTVVKVTRSDRQLLCHLQHDSLPLAAILQIEVEGHVATFRGQVFWNGTDAVDMDVYYPLLSRVAAAGPAKDRVLLPVLSGAVHGPLASANVRKAYIGNVSSPCFILDGEDRGLAFLDDNQADRAADPVAACRRSFAAGTLFPLPPDVPCHHIPQVAPGVDGPYVSVCHTRRFAAIAAEDGLANAASSVAKPTVAHDGESVDMGPIRMYAYEGGWRQGASWLREQLRDVPFRTSPAEWFQRTTFMGEENCYTMTAQGKTFHQFPAVLQSKRKLGADFFHFYGFHDADELGEKDLWRNRGDYFLAAQDYGGFKAARSGIEAIHRSGGRVIYYVEGLIVWKRSRIGLAKGRDWSLRRADGSEDVIYKGYWHMCPACAEWRAWLAATCAEIVRTTGVDGFFIDSQCATPYHRCFNPLHHHPHPDVWNWGVRQLLREVRAAVDAVNPNTIIIVEGVADLAREFADGSLSHSHDWTGWKLDEPLLRFLHPQMRVFESWTNRRVAPRHKPPEYLHVWNSVVGHRIYAHNSEADSMAALAQRTRRVYDSFPEICDSELSAHEVACANGFAQLFDGPPPVLTLGNLTARRTTATVTLPVASGSLFDRLSNEHLALTQRRVQIKLAPWEYRAFEVRV